MQSGKVLAAILCMAVFFPALTAADDKQLSDSLLACSSFEDDARRLDCVDGLIQSISTPVVVQSVPASQPALPLTEETSVAETNEPGGDEPGDDEPGSDEPGVEALGKKYLPEPEETATPPAVNFALVAAYKDHDKRWVFELDNGQIWRQIEPRYLPTLKGLPVAVNISKGVFGSHNLRVEKYGKPVKVKRLH